MPEAIATTKRKFYKALDSFTASSEVSLASSTSSPGAGAKRPATAAEAFDAARARASKRLRQSVSNSSISSIPLKVPAATAPSKDGPAGQKPPNFSPWSHETFLARLKTFSSVSRWHPKPEAINEVEWAKRGWVCVTTNTVGCRGGCEKRVVVSLDTPERDALLQQGDEIDEDDENDESALETALVERYKTMIVEGHSDNCLWRQSGCKDDIYHLQVVRPAVWQPNLRKRFQSILDVGNAVASVNMQGLDKESSDISARTLLRLLPASLLGSADQASEETLQLKALMAALHGWQGSTQAGSELLVCEACFQRVGLWMYQPDYKPSISRSNDEDESTGHATLDLDRLHREHCPWHNPITQKSSGSLSAMNATQILYRVVSTYAREQHRRSNREEITTDEGAAEQEEATEDDAPVPPVLSKEEIAKQDSDRESRFRKLKSLFSIKRRPTKMAPKRAQT